MVQGDFENHLFVGLKIKQVRLVYDRQTDRFRGKTNCFIQTKLAALKNILQVLLTSILKMKSHYVVQLN